MTSDFLTPKVEAKYLTSSALASPSVGGAEIAMPTASSEISMDIRLHFVNNIPFFFFTQNDNARTIVSLNKKENLSNGISYYQLCCYISLRV